ncbi:glycosyltransferase family 4 protein [Flagellimonas zhangzhouensis]|uniref:Glycosyltransferase involved in cell wall bisynthesis n=1 Tax=Flagellimonas zhangzhouensis TaxID=1073328 RepID=A0A1H2YRM7_9FLAO|nr:glycosyltransferase family 4 protein [Allomuricauda zhangzhouensis]SDR00348.1 Glycosyltransferase involved in cell wall bisynthesis [Allomuricauda zhangzhouensis]SDX07468.1 Glycosyltransferase involved in cell wall bisynthesis [Allomuricauda zhangzhouensis]
MAKLKVLIICSVSYSLINFRKDFIEELVQSGYEVWCAGPDFSKDISDKVKAMGAHPVDFNLQRKGLNPLKDFKSVGELKKILKDIEVDFVFAYTIKPVIYGAFAAQQLNLKIFSLITGLGFTFSGVSLKAKLLGQVSKLLYKLALRKNNVAIFQNVDDQTLFSDQGILPKGQKSYVVNGSGINLDRFEFKEPDEFNKGDRPLNFILIGRLMIEKGIELYLDTAEAIHEKKGNAIFHVVGNPPEHLTELEARLKNLNHKGVIVYHGVQMDVRPYLKAADIFVLPTFYREGVPRSILEALSVGMPIITTKTPGCRETVIESKNGFIIPPKQLPPLIEAASYFLENPDKIEVMGRESRKLAEQKFDVRLVNADLLNIIKQNTA